jgi:hypothetical protein
MGFQVNMEFDDGELPALRMTPEEFAKEIQFLAAAKWYEMGEVSQEMAAEIAGMNRLDFLLGISRIQA